MTSDQGGEVWPFVIGYWVFVILSSFGFRHSSFNERGSRRGGSSSVPDQRRPAVGATVILPRRKYGGWPRLKPHTWGTPRSRWPTPSFITPAPVLDRTTRPLSPAASTSGGTG